MKIRIKLSIIVILIMIVVIAALAIIFLQQATTISLDLSAKSITYLAETQAEFWKAREDGYIRVLKTVANVMADYESVAPELRRDRYDTLLRGVLQGEPMITSIYSIWKSNALDGMDREYMGRVGSSFTGQYAINYSQEGTLISGSSMSQADITTAVANTTGPTAKLDMVFDPTRARIDGKDTHLIKMSVPVINPRTNETVARVGCLLSIDAIQPELEKVIASHEEISAMMVYSKNGLIMGHVAPDRIGRQLREAETFGDNIDAANKAVLEGDSFSFSYYSTVVNSNIELFMVPFQIGNSNHTWTVAIGSAENHILGPVKRMTLLIMIMAVIAIAAAGIIISVVLTRMTKPIVRVADNLKDIAEGEGDLTRRIDINSKDEVGDLSH
jgi:methyl-accepting chemotaxis protein